MKLMELYRRLLRHFGRQNWWPARTRFEMMVGAILTQRTKWENAEKAVKNLEKAGLLNPVALAKTPVDKLERLVRPAGFYRQKARRLLSLAKLIADEYRGDLDAFLGRPPEEFRKELLSIYGVGKETADSILLYAADKLYFPVDAYTKQILHRMGLTPKNIGYEQLRGFIEENIDRDLAVYREFRALLVVLGKTYCRKRPLCQKCPVSDLCSWGSGRRGNAKMPAEG